MSESKFGVVFGAPPGLNPELSMAKLSRLDSGLPY